MLRIGALQFEFPVVQAALSGYSDGPMRLIARRMGAPYALSGLILDKSIAISPKARRKLLGTLAEEDHPVGGQLAGSDPEHFATAANILVEAGYDVIDINFGCPVRKVVARRRGGYLLGDPPAAIEIMRGVRDAVPSSVPVTVKMRRGIDHSAESERDFFTIFDAAFELGLAAVTLHPRTVTQQYRGRSDWDFLARAKRHAGDKTVLGSGDLYTAHDIKRMLEQTGVDGVTAARGCIGNPWIFADARAVLAAQPLPEPPAVPEQGRLIHAHYELSAARHGEHLAARIMRKFAIKYSELHPYTRDVRKAFVQSRSSAEWLSALAKWYDPHRDWPPGKRKNRLGQQIAAGASD